MRCGLGLFLEISNSMFSWLQNKNQNFTLDADLDLFLLNWFYRKETLNYLKFNYFIHLNYDFLRTIIKDRLYFIIILKYIIKLNLTPRYKLILIPFGWGTKKVQWKPHGSDDFPGHRKTIGLPQEAPSSGVFRNPQPN